MPIEIIVAVAATALAGCAAYYFFVRMHPHRKELRRQKRRAEDWERAVEAVYVEYERNGQTELYRDLIAAREAVAEDCRTMRRSHELKLRRKGMKK